MNQTSMTQLRDLANDTLSLQHLFTTKRMLTDHLPGGTYHGLNDNCIITIIEEAAHVSNTI